jgi:hypothetical protein
VAEGDWRSHIDSQLQSKEDQTIGSRYEKYKGRVVFPRGKAAKPAKQDRQTFYLSTVPSFVNVLRNNDQRKTIHVKESMHVGRDDLMNTRLQNKIRQFSSQGERQTLCGQDQ